MPPRSTKLRKREIALALSIGVMAAGGAAAVMVAMLADDAIAPAAVAASNPTYDVAPFDEIATVGPQDVLVTRGEIHAVRAEGPPQVLAQLEVVVEDGRLTIQPKDRFRRGFNWGRFSSATFYVTAPRLEAASLAGSGDIRIDRVEGARFTGTVAGPGELTLDSMQVDETDLTLAGSGSLVAAGTAREARVAIGGSGEVNARGLRSETASVSIGGSGDAALTVQDQARVSVMGSGDVEIDGPARCSVSRMGSGSVSCDGAVE